MVANDIVPEDISEQNENALIEAQIGDTVQVFPNAITGAGSRHAAFGVQTMFERKSLLGIRGTYRRLMMQYSWYHHEDNSMFRSAISGLTKRVQSLPYEIKSPEEDGAYWDNLLRYSNFSTWEEFIAQLVINYSIYDIGAFVEIIAPGDPRSEPTGAATGIAILDSRRCWPTGDPLYPVIYTNNEGQQHIMHRSRVVQFVDMGESNDVLPGWGDSAVSRCISAIFREVLMTQYMRASLDDMPAPGFAIAKNLTEKQVYAQLDRMKEKRENDQDMLGRLVFLFGADTAQIPALEFVQFAKEFTGFDPDKLSAMNAKYIAAGIGLDVQDFWELSGAGIGTATQSEVLDQKSKGRALGRLIKGFERLVNDVFPDDVEFVIKYRNEEEDLERAQTAQAWTTVIQMLESVTTIDERRIIATNQIPALKDAVTDDAGNVIRWNDTDPQTQEQATNIWRLMSQSADGGESTAIQPVSGESATELQQLVLDRMNSTIIDVFTAALLLGNANPAEELRGMFWVGNQLVPQNQLQNIWKYGTLIAPSTTNADLIVEEEPDVLGVDESVVTVAPEPVTPQLPETTPPEQDVPDDNLVVGEEKDYRRTAASFKRTFNEVTKFLTEGILTAGSANVIILNELKEDGEEAYIDGLKRAGVKKPTFDDRGQRELSSWLTKQRPLITGYVADVESGKYTAKQLANKGLQWANGSLSDMLYKGMEANTKKKWRWVTNFFKENCVTCLALHGQVHQFKTYSSRNLLPKSVRLVCHGDNCGCKLVADDGPAKGRIRRVRFVRRSFSFRFTKARLN